MGECTDLAIIVEDVARRYPVAPITNHVQINNEPMRDAVLQLVGTGYPEAVAGEYSLPPKKEVNAGFWQSLGYTLRHRFAGSKRKRQLEEAQRQRSLFLEVQQQYEWLNSAVNVIDVALEQLRTSHTNVADYVMRTRVSLGRANEFLDPRIIEGQVRELQKLKTDVVDPAHRDVIMSYLGDNGENGWQQVRREEEAAIEKLSLGISEYRQAVVYVTQLVTHYETVVSSSEETLQTLNAVMLSAIPQRLDLERTLHVYDGLTRNQINASRAVQFLEGVDRITKDFKISIEAVNTAFHEIGSGYAERPLPTPVPDPQLVVARREIAGLLDKE